MAARLIDGRLEGPSPTWPKRVAPSDLRTARLADLGRPIAPSHWAATLAKLLPAELEAPFLTIGSRQLDSTDFSMESS